MSVKLPNGAKVSIAALGAAIAVTAISNAAQAVVSAAANGLAENDIVLMSSGWSPLNDRAFRAVDVEATEFTLEKVDSTSVAKYPAGASAGSFRKAAANDWTQITQVLDTASAGGDPQFWNYSFLEDASGDEKQMPTGTSPVTFTFTLADDADLPHYDVLLAAAEAKQVEVIKVELVNGDFMLWPCYIGFTGVPTMTKNQGMANTLTLSLAGRPTRYKRAA